MNNLRLLGIRPYKGCHRKLVKNLQIGTLYKFYAGAKFLDENFDEVGQHAPVRFIEFDSIVPNSLYTVVTADDIYPLNINISAIAGRNGAGKSTLMELFFATIFAFSVKKDLITPTTENLKGNVKYWERQLRDLQVREDQLKLDKQGYSSDFNKEIKKSSSNLDYDSAEMAIKEQIRRENIIAEKTEEALRFLNKERARLKEYKRMSDRVKADIFYQIDDKFYQMTVDPDLSNGASLFRIPEKNKGNIEKIEIQEQHNLIESLFYTIAVNNSHYSLNSRYLGDWIKLLFHKNDGYRTPLVINPMRNEGNFDINDETAFARTRLLNNLLIAEKDRPSYITGVPITENQFVSEVYFTLDKAKISNIPTHVTSEGGGGLRSNNKRYLDLLMGFLNAVFKNEPYTVYLGWDYAIKDILLNYIINKIESISERYIEFQPGFKSETDSSSLEHNKRFFQKLTNDQTHVTYKLKQAVNFLRYNLETAGNNRFYIDKKDLKGNKIVRFSFSLSELLRWMNDPVPTEIIPFLPPPLFEVDFKLVNKRGNSSWFSALSSGEQQNIHIIQSILYHLNNIQSAHADPDRVKYKGVNIVLDEIELYFHPDFQRSFIYNLLMSFESMYIRQGSHIEAINILFLTHSPFILSDIPTENILRLKINSKHGKSLPIEGEFKTFAANIHELLAHSFFINGTLMGKFAEDTINRLIEKIKKKKELNNEDNAIIEMIGDTFLKSSISRFKQLNSNDQNSIQ